MDKSQVMAMMQYRLNDGNQLVFGDFKQGQSQTCWNYWERTYYPIVIKESYPVYLQERAMDKGAKAYEIVKHLLDKKIIKLEKVADFVEAMDVLIKIL